MNTPAATQDAVVSEQARRDALAAYIEDIVIDAIDGRLTSSHATDIILDLCQGPEQ